MTLYIGDKPVGLMKVVEKKIPVISDEWQPNPNWWDIKKILDEDTRDYAGKVGVILYDFNDVSDFTLSSSGMTAVATSDGAFYSYADNGANVSHNWDTSKDKDDGRGFKTRWVIYYYTTDTTSDTFKQADAAFGWAYNYIAYLVLRINCSTGNSFCKSQQFLECIENNRYEIKGTDFSYFCQNCYLLQKLPDELNTSNGTTFSYFCDSCYSLTKLPDGLNTGNGKNFGRFCRDCHSLTKLPDGLNTGNGTDFRNFCYSCHSLTGLPDGLDTSNGKDFTYFCGRCYSLTGLPDGLDTSKGTNFNYFCQECYSLTKLPDGLDTSNGTIFSYFCDSCYSLSKLPDGLNTGNGTDFRNFCYSCHSLTKLPNGLDVSNGTNFNNFCYYCYSLTGLPDGLDTSNGKDFTYFCVYCSSLQTVPQLSLLANSYSLSTSASPFINCPWLKEASLTLPINTNFWLNSSTRISIESFRYIADHAPDVTATPRTLTVGKTNISRINAEDPTIITDLNARGWSVN